LILHGDPERTNPQKLWTKPKPLDAKGILNSVSCPSSSLCIAVDLMGRAVTYGH
jgi:hypothetical protein